MASHNEGREKELSYEQLNSSQISGLGISVPGSSLYRAPAQSSQPPNSISPQGPSPVTDAHLMTPPDLWNPQLSGKTMADFNSPASNNNDIDNLRGSIYSAWDNGARAATYAPLSDDKGSRGKDMDNISLDSLQIRDDDNVNFGVSFSTVNTEDQNADNVCLTDNKYTQDKYVENSPTESSRRAEVKVKRTSWLSVYVIVLTVYSTLVSGLWLAVAIAQPKWGRTISSGGSLSLSNANLLIVIFAKTIELSFVTIFVAFIGQVLTRRAHQHCMTKADMAMRSWILQPGSMLSNGHTLRYAGASFLGAMTLIATLSATFYTTASDTMVRPKLRFGEWKQRDLHSYIMASYANVNYVQDACATPITTALDKTDAGASCLGIQYSGNSYHNLLAFMSSWRDISYNGSGTSRNISERPNAQAMLYDNVSMSGSWIEAEYSNPADSFDTYKRIINNVSLAMPHPGIYKAATDPVNGILQPRDLDGLGAYNISASVISPAVNVLCVNMNRSELAPLVYIEWPNAILKNTTVPGQSVGHQGWDGEVPPPFNNDTTKNWLNKTVVDDVFMWGEIYGRRPPVFQMYPLDNNTITNTTVMGTNITQADAMYLFGKSRFLDDYTLCELRSWPAIQCSTQFDVSGITGMSMEAHCDDPADTDAYYHVMAPGDVVAANPDWKYLVDGWRLAIDLNGGTSNNNASNARILTELALNETRLHDNLPSMAEALAVLVSSTLVAGSVDTPFIHYWNYTETSSPASVAGILPVPGDRVTFKASVKTQQYVSRHTQSWQGIFYVVLAAVFAINCFCLSYFCRAGLVTDFLEPGNLFALAVNSPPSDGGPKKRDLVVPYRLAYKENANYYFFEQASDRAWRGGKWRDSTATGVDLGGGGGGGQEGVKGRGSYYRMSKSWL